MDGLPPLPALRAFEAAARLESFQHAAAELFVTAGAVAHQVKVLEGWLDVPLFQRHARGVTLTDAGRRYAEQVRLALSELVRASRQLQREVRDAQLVTVSAMPSLVTRWLMPRLSHFRDAYPGFEVRVLAEVRPTDFRLESVDVGIRLGSGPYPGLLADVLFDEYMLAVASPAFLAAHPLGEPADLLGVTLLHDEYEARVPLQINWPRWLQAQGVTVPARLPGPSFSHTYLTLEAAMAGQGVAIASQPILGDTLDSGRLVALFDGTGVPGPYRFHLLRLPDSTQRAAVKAFCEWVKAEAATGT